MPLPILTAQLTTRRAAELTGYSVKTLRNARCTGMLGGVSAPRFRKMGRGHAAVRYDAAELEAWIAQFEPQTKTPGGGHV